MENTEKTLNYIIVALRHSEVAEVCEILKGKGKSSIAIWLDRNKDTLYGNVSEDWKPFSDKSIIEILKSKENKFICANEDVDFDDDRNRVSFLERASLYIIDNFALLHEKYSKLIPTIDTCCDSESHCSCFLFCSKKPTGIQGALYELYTQQLESIPKKYFNGLKCRIVTREDDLHNFMELSLLDKYLKDRKDAPTNVRMLETSDKYFNHNEIKSKNLRPPG